MNWCQETDSAERKKAKKALEKAKAMEQEKLKNGYRYKQIDSKTHVLRKD